MTQLSDAMVERLYDSLGATVDRENGELEFMSGDGEDVVLHFNPDTAVEDIIDQAENFDEDAHVLQHTDPQGDPSSLRHSLSDIRDAAKDYPNDVESTYYRLKNWRDAGWSDKDIKDEIENGGLRSYGGGHKFDIDLDNGVIRYDSPIIDRDLGTGYEMTVDEVIEAIRDDLNVDVDDLICEEIGVTGPEPGAPEISELIEDSQGIHWMLDCMSDILQDQRDIEQQEESR